MHERGDAVDGNNNEGSDEARQAAPLHSLRRVSVSDLLAGDRELILVHRHAEYRLRLTNNDKLILTK